MLDDRAKATLTMFVEQTLSKPMRDGGRRPVGKGALSAMLALTRIPLEKEDELPFPLDPEKMRTEQEGQVKGLGGGVVKKILEEHGITAKLSSEGGRTSRGTMGNLRIYWSILNEIWSRLCAESPELDPVETGRQLLRDAEDWWIERIQEFFKAKPLEFRTDASKSLQAHIEELLQLVRTRYAGTTQVGTVLQYLVGAKLKIVLPDTVIHAASQSDEQTDRAGDFLAGETAIHCTTAPSSDLIGKCRANLGAGLAPVIITIPERIGVARGLAADGQGTKDRIQVWDIAQFLATNVLEHGRFSVGGSMDMLKRLVEAYNGIVEECESDPGLRIKLSEASRVQG